MSRFKIPSREDANVDTHSTLDAVGKRLGFIPNLHRLIYQSKCFCRLGSTSGCLEANA
jgi:hypothetical protein